MTSDAIAAGSHHARESDGSKMAQILEQLGSGEDLPVDAIRAATADRAAMVPVILRAFDDSATAGPSLQTALFFAFHLLGQWREKSAYRPLAAFLRRPAEEIDPIINGAATATTHRVMASIFDGDPKPLYEVILEPTADEFIRARMCAALAMVTLRGELPREEAARFLRSCYDSLQPRDECYVWDGWQGAIAMLGLSELKPLVKQAFERGSIDPGWLGFEDFEQDLQCAIDGEVPPSWAKDEYELFGDTIEELSSWAAFAPKRKQARRPDDVWRPQPTTPAVNAFKGVGRNDPCPCGSGKKFKKCCLDKVRLDQPAPILPKIEQSRPDAGFDHDEFDLDEVDETSLDYDPLEDPDPEQWLLTDEQRRIDLVMEYHQVAGISLPNEKVHATLHVIVENQIADEELPVRRKLTQLMSEGLDRHDAIHAIGSVLASHIVDLLREADEISLSDKQASDRDPNEPYFAELECLTAKSWRRSA
jgi:uncharacterized protein DUF1186/SEC-C motif-containing protein